MREQFGDAYAESVAKDFVLSDPRHGGGTIALCAADPAEHGAGPSWW